MSEERTVIEYLVRGNDEHSTTVLFEVEPDPESGIVQVSRDVLKSAPTTFQDALERVKPAIQAISQTLRDINHPDTIALEFGLKLTAATGVVIASASTEVTFKVTLTWRREA